MEFKIVNPIINIDWLTFNCSGTNANWENVSNQQFSLELQDIGTKIFKKRYFLFSEGQKVCTILCQPHSKAMKQDLIQIQISNHLFYTHSLFWLKKLIKLYIEKLLKINIVSISRLDISIDFDNTNENVQQLVKLINSNDLKLAGKDKKYVPHYIFNNGNAQLTGLTVGSRSSSRFLRVYNKSLELQSNPKEYIQQKWKKFGLIGQNIWRCEYQLNSVFFQFLKIDGLTITDQIFTSKGLIKLFQLAELNHFEIKQNTGKSQLNKELTVPFFDTLNIMNFDENDSDFNVVKLRNIIEPSILVQKRILKASLREYYISKQFYPNIFLIQYIIEKYQLYDYLETKIDFYLDEFRNQQKSNFEFDKQLFNEHLITLYNE